MKKFLIASSITLLAISMLPVSMKAAKAEETNSIATTSVLEDLEKLEYFSTESYRYGFQNLYFVENGFDNDSNTNYSLYYYCYIADGSDPAFPLSKAKLKICQSSDLNNVTEENATYLNMTIQSLQKNYCKWKIDDPSGLLPNSLGDRTYGIFGFKYKVCDISFGGAYQELWSKEYSLYETYTFNGKAVTSEGETSTLTCNYHRNTHLELKVEGTTWLSEDYVGARNCLYSAYFELPVDVLDYYGHLSGIDFKYDFLASEYMYYLKSTYNGKISMFQNFSPLHDGVPKIVSTDTSEILKSSFYYYNTSEISDGLVFRGVNWDSSVRGYDICQRVINNNNLINSSFHVERHLTDTSFDIDAVSTKINFNPFMELMISAIYGMNTTHGIDLTNVKVFQEIKYADTRAAKNDQPFDEKFLIDKKDSTYFRLKARSALTSGYQPYFFRFHQALFESTAIYNSELPFGRQPVGYVFHCGVVKDFEILEMTFEKEGKMTILPVVMDPINIAPNAVPNEIHESAFSSIIRIIMTVLLVILIGYIIVKVVVPLLSSRKEK